MNVVRIVLKARRALQRGPGRAEEDEKRSPVPLTDQERIQDEDPYLTGLVRRLTER